MTPGEGSGAALSAVRARPARPEPPRRPARGSPAQTLSSVSSAVCHQSPGEVTGAEVEVDQVDRGHASLDEGDVVVEDRRRLAAEGLAAERRRGGVRVRLARDQRSQSPTMSSRYIASIRPSGGAPSPPPSSASATNWRLPRGPSSAKGRSPARLLGVEEGTSVRSHGAAAATGAAARARSPAATATPEAPSLAPTKPGMPSGVVVGADDHDRRAATGDRRDDVAAGRWTVTASTPAARTQLDDQGDLAAAADAANPAGRGPISTCCARSAERPARRRSRCGRWTVPLSTAPSSPHPPAASAASAAAISKPCSTDASHRRLG